MKPAQYANAPSAVAHVITTLPRPYPHCSVDLFNISHNNRLRIQGISGCLARNASHKQQD